MPKDDKLKPATEQLAGLGKKYQLLNAELQSSNAELQSSNAELQTSSEELQSVNEALNVVNTELGGRVRDLGRANIDLQNLLESTQIATILLDSDQRLRSFTPTAIELFGLHDTDVGRSVAELRSRIVYPELNEDLCQVLAQRGTVERHIWSEAGRSYIARVLPYQGVDKLIAGAVITFVDVTSAIRAELALHEREAQLQVLLAELQHRVRNTLAVVKSIAKRTADSSSSVDEMAAHLNGRLDAFARVQSAVTRNPDAGVSLRSLVDDELLAHAMHEGDGLTVHGPDVALRTKAAETMSLALHELATNAVKHGEVANHNGGQIEIKWKLKGRGAERDLNFEWAENNGDRALPEPTRHGFGMELLTQILPYDLEAKTSVEFRGNGLRFQMDLPSHHLAELRRV